MLTKQQIQTVKVAQRKLSLDDPHYRMILSRQGVTSCKDLTNDGFEQVMATLEEIGSSRTPPILITATPNYWRTKASSGGHRMAWMIHKLYADYLDLTAHVPEEELYKLSGLCSRFSAGRARNVDDMLSHEQFNLIEALKEVIAREQATAVPTPATPEQLEHVPF